MNPVPALLISLGLLCAAASATAADAGEAARRLFYERTLMSEADRRCALFTPPVSAALKAGAVQARGAALRGGVGDADLKRAAVDARAKARSVACASADLRTAAGRVRTGFEGWSRLTRLNVHGWTADRTRSPGRWRLSQTANGVTLGLEGVADRPTVSARADGPVPASVRLRVRDPMKDPHPNLRGPALKDKLPDPADSKVLWASSREAAAAGLTPGGGENGRLWRLPPGSSAALAGLDPREAVAVEFVYAGRGRESVRPVLFEVGDFAAGLAFLQAGAPR